MALLLSYRPRLASTDLSLGLSSFHRSRHCVQDCLRQSAWSQLVSLERWLSWARVVGPTGTHSVEKEEHTERLLCLLQANWSDGPFSRLVPPLSCDKGNSTGNKNEEEAEIAELTNIGFGRSMMLVWYVYWAAYYGGLRIGNDGYACVNGQTLGTVRSRGKGTSDPDLTAYSICTLSSSEWPLFR